MKLRSDCTGPGKGVLRPSAQCWTREREGGGSSHLEAVSGSYRLLRLQLEPLQAQ